MTDEQKTVSPAGDPITADAFEQERDALWDWCRAADPSMSRAEFAAAFERELSDIRKEEADARP